jgi:hypothetical protein
MFSLTAFFTLALLAAPSTAPTSSDTTLPPPLAPAEPVMPKTLHPALPSLFIAGDSTAAKGPPTATGWGVPFAAYFDSAKINVVNAARGGRSGGGGRRRLVAHARQRQLQRLELRRDGRERGGAHGAAAPCWQQYSCFAYAWRAWRGD